MDKLLDIINKAIWTPDCGGKWDLDFPVLECNTRYWRYYTAAPSFICSLRSENDYDYITLLEERYIVGDSEEDCKFKVKEWYKNNIIKAIEILLNKLKEELNEEV